MAQGAGTPGETAGRPVMGARRIGVFAAVTVTLAAAVAVNIASVFWYLVATGAISAASAVTAPVLMRRHYCRKVSERPAREWPLTKIEISYVNKALPQAVPLAETSEVNVEERR